MVRPYGDTLCAALVLSQLRPNTKIILGMHRVLPPSLANLLSSRFQETLLQTRAQT